MHTQSLPFRLTALTAALLVSHAASAATNYVSSCTDDPAPSATLRNVINVSAPGDTVDLTHLDPTCSVITLTTGSAPNGPIVVGQAAGASGLGLKIQGPGANKLAISAANNTRIFTHTGAGELLIDGLTIEKGTVYGPNNTTTPQKGGCIASYGTLYLSNSTVSDCAVVSSGGSHAAGGGIYGVNVTLVRSSLIGNSAGPAPGATGFAVGGGIFAVGSLILNRSTISGNEADAPSGSLGVGGGVDSSGGLIAVYSSISNNVGAEALYAVLGSGGTASISHSTISGNKARGIQISSTGQFMLSDSTVSDNGSWGAYVVQLAPGTANISSSTIAFNGGGLCLENGGATTVRSTIISNNSTDLDGTNYTLSGSNNIVMQSLIPYPFGFVSSQGDPKLGPLQNNGGRTLTRMLSRGSPALGAGYNPSDVYDQRGYPFPRDTGATNVVDIGAVQFDTIFADGLDGT